MATKRSAKKVGNGVSEKVRGRQRSGEVGGPAKMKGGAPFNEQDAKRRLGNFNGAGEHSLIGGRTTGIVGQRKGQFRTENRVKARKKSR